jgi:hypothetical protein
VSGARWLAQDHGMGRHGAELAQRQWSWVAVRAFPMNEARRERLSSLVPLRGSDDTTMMRHWGPLSAVGRGDDIATEAGQAEWWQDGEGHGRMADGGGRASRQGGISVRFSGPIPIINFWYRLFKWVGS